MKKGKLDLSVLTPGQRDAYIKNEEWREKNPGKPWHLGYTSTKTQQSLYNSARMRLGLAPGKVKAHVLPPVVNLDILSAMQRKHYLAIESARKTEPRMSVKSICERVAEASGDAFNSVSDNYYAARRKFANPSTARPYKRRGLAKVETPPRDMLEFLAELKPKPEVPKPKSQMQTFIVPDEVRRSGKAFIILADISDLKTILKEIGE